MKSRSAARLKIAIALLLGIAIGFAAWFGVALDHVQADSTHAAESYERGYSDGVQDTQPIIDKQMNAPKSGYIRSSCRKTRNGRLVPTATKPLARTAVGSRAPLWL